MDNKQRLQLQNMIKANGVENYTGLIRELKHSQVLRNEVNKLIVIKARLLTTADRYKKMIIGVGGKKINIPKRPGEPDRTFADISKINSHIGWSPKITIEEGVAHLLSNIDYWKDAPVWTPDKIKEATSDWFKFLGNEK